MKSAKTKGRASVQILAGSQWGDEGKGRVVDVLSEKADVIVRYQGGANAGHTVIVEGKKHVFHLLPSGILYPNRLCVIGSGVVLDPDQLRAELEGLDQDPSKVGTRLVISNGAQIVMPYHKKLDALSERAKSRSSSAAPIGTTGRGIGPCYVDKYDRVGIRAEDLADPEVLRTKLKLNVELKSEIFEKIYGEAPLDFDSLYEQASKWGEYIKPFLGDSSYEIDAAYRAGKNILFEGAQATLLDIDHGTYPFVTSSNCIAGGACTGAAIAPSRVDRVIGVVKAYTTRVGEGPFPTEDHGDDGAKLRERGAEFGATTGRPRRCGWLDLVLLRYAQSVNGFDLLALTKLDVLSGLDEIKICTSYEIDGKIYDRLPGSPARIASAVPVYTSLKGWKEDISSARSFDDLPEAARAYVDFIEREMGAQVWMIGVGPGREDTIFRELPEDADR